MWGRRTGFGIWLYLKQGIEWLESLFNVDRWMSVCSTGSCDLRLMGVLFACTLGKVGGLLGRYLHKLEISVFLFTYRSVLMYSCFCTLHYLILVSIRSSIASF